MSSPGADPRLHGWWGHSFEEDRAGITVYRPQDFDFPRARGRAAIELRADGTFVEWAVGRGDARQARPGTWALDTAGRLRVTTDSGERDLGVVSLAADRLELTTGA